MVVDVVDVVAVVSVVSVVSVVVCATAVPPSMSAAAIMTSFISSLLVGWTAALAVAALSLNEAETIFLR
jgi:hypothetical protein